MPGARIALEDADAGAALGQRQAARQAYDTSADHGDIYIYLSHYY